MKIATPTKLPNDIWGAKLNCAVEIGEIITIRTAGGKEWQARVTTIISAGPQQASVVVAQSVEGRPARTGGSLTDRGMIRVNGPRGGYVRKITKLEAYDEL